MPEHKAALVAGGAGFIGFHLVKKLMRDGYRVICVDNFYSGSRENLSEFLREDNFTLIEHDVRAPLYVPEKLHEVYNLACPASPMAYQKDPLLTLETNFLGTKNLLDLALINGARFFQASTSEVYGTPLAHPQKESYWGNVNPVGVRSCYDEGKRVAEAMCADYRRIHKFSIRIVRIFNTYGPRMAVNDGRVVSNFIVQALRNEDITVYGDGSHTRSFQYVDDLIAGISRVMNEDHGGPINLGNPEEHTMLRLANMVLEITKSKSRIIHKPLPADDPEKRKPDIELAKKLLRWEPQVSLREGLEKTVEYFQTVI